jgi:hypothetical protein
MVTSKEEIHQSSKKFEVDDQGLFGKIQLSQSHQKRKSFKVQRSLKWKDLMIINLSQGLKGNEVYLGSS